MLTHPFHPLFPIFCLSLWLPCLPPLWSPLLSHSSTTSHTTQVVTLLPHHAAFPDLHTVLPVTSTSCSQPALLSLWNKRERWNLISCLPQSRSTPFDFSFLRNAENWDLTSCKESKHLQLISESACLLHPSCLFLPLGPSLNCRNDYSNSGPVLWFLGKTHNFPESQLTPQPPSLHQSYGSYGKICCLCHWEETALAWQHKACTGQDLSICHPSKNNTGLK